MLFLLVVIVIFLAVWLAKDRRRHRQKLTDQAIAAGESVPARLAPFWRRLVAFTLDLSLLGAVDDAGRYVFSDPLSHFDDYRGLVAWAVVIVYFGCLESRWGRGRSIGKHLLDICVVLPDNTYLSPVAAGLRAALATASVIFNGAVYESAIGGALLGLAILGPPLSTLYLVAISNSERRALLHDLVFGTLVVRQEDRDLQRPPPKVPPLWKGHLVVVGLLLLASMAVVPLTLLYLGK